MKLVAITLPRLCHGEAEAIAAMLRSGRFDRVHIRKPGASEEDVERLIRGIPPELYPRLSVHYHHRLAVRHALGGVHLSRICPQPPAGWRGLVSRSIHSVAEIGATDCCDYAFLSPVYPSISKPGYGEGMDLRELSRHITPRIYALGGVTFDRLPELADAGFAGAAMLGGAWGALVPEVPFTLQLITHPLSGLDVVSGARLAIDGGCRWVQLRHKDAPVATLAEEARCLRRLTRSSDAVFIIDDHVELAEEVGADGVHLGKNDMPVEEARRILGSRRIIGATANTIGDIRHAAAAGADYVGLGPYRFTSTKERLSPVIGLEGYRRIFSQLRREGITIPIVVIGGITASDVEPLRSAGACAVAVSGAILRAADPPAECARFLKLLNT